MVSSLEIPAYHLFTPFSLSRTSWFSLPGFHKVHTSSHSLGSCEFSVIRHNHWRSCNLSCRSNNAYGSSDHDQRHFSSDQEKTQGLWGESLSSKELLKKLKKYGISGVLSYGLLNTVYYTLSFLFVWFFVAPTPGKMGYAAAVKRFLKVMAMVWAGSQVTKLIRAGGFNMFGALALAPFVDTGLSWLTVKLKFESKGKAFMVVVGFCLGLAVMLFLIVTLLWA